MNKEPIILYIFRLLLTITLIGFVIMLYWSSDLLESDVLKLTNEVKQLKQEIQTLRSDVVTAIQKVPVQHQQKEIAAETTSRPHIDPSLPNLLEEDPFFQKTLPEILGPDFVPAGIFHNDTLGKPDNLHPFSPWASVIEWTSRCGLSVARLQFGKFETFAPNMAIKVEERENPKTKEKEFWVHLRDGVFWQPLKQDFFSRDFSLSPHFFEKHQVTAEDFKFYYDALSNPAVSQAGAVALRTYYNDIKEIEIIDPLTFIVRWNGIETKKEDGTPIFKPKYIAKEWTGGLRPLASFVYKYFSDGTKIVEDDTSPDTYRKNTLWAQNFNQHWASNIIVSCGPWMFDGMSDREIRFVRNRDHFFPNDVLVESSEIQIKETPEAIWEDFKINKIDYYSLRPDQLIEFNNFQKSDVYKKQSQEKNAVNRLDYIDRAYTYIGWNEARPFFNSKKVRQALTMAIDRQRIIRQNLNGMGIELACPFYPYSSAYDHSIKPWPYDPTLAKRQLEEEGWYDSDGDGIIDKEIEGKRTPFRFGLTYYVKNPTSKAICEYISTALKEIGIDCQLRGVDIADISSVFDDKNFDAIAMGWATGSPPEDPKQLWHSSGAKQRGSSNAIGFANAEADQLIDQLQYESDENKRIKLYHRFCAIIHDEAPYTFLYTPKVAMIYREYLRNVFIPAERQDLIPGADVGQPDSSIFFIRR